MQQITSFSGKYFFLSNFYPCQVEFESIIYPSSEHAYMAAKTVDVSVRKTILNIETPGKVKQFGKTIELRSNWNNLRLHFMDLIVKSKFSNSDLMEMLDETKGYELIEGNTWGDKFWGQSPLGVGRNELGKLLMSIRDDITRL